MVRIRKFAVGLITLAAAVLPGCGWSARDSHLARPGAIAPRSGDGSKLTSHAPEDPFATADGASIAESFDR